MKNLTLEELFYFAFFILLSVTKGLGFYEGQALFKLLVIPAFICAIIKIFITPYTKKQWAVQLVLLFLSALIYYESRSLGIFFIMFTILGMKDISVKKVFKLGLYTWTACAVVLSIFSFFRLEHTIYRVHPKMGLGPIFRWSLGFTHPNILHITYFVLCAYIIYELADRYSLKHFIILMLGNVLVFIYSVSYTGFGITALLVAGGLYIKIRPKFNLFEKIAANLVLPILIVVSFVLPLMFHVKWIQKLDNYILGYRIILATLFLTPEYVSPFGVKTADVIRSDMTMDSSYIWGFINYGIIPFALLMIAYLILVADYSRKQKTRELLIVISFFVAGFTEQLLFNTSFKNITIIFLGELLFRQKEGAKEYCLFPALQRNIELPFKSLNIVIPKLKKCALYICAGAVIGVILCAFIRTEPKGYIVPRTYTDGYDKNSYIYVESDTPSGYDGYVVMNYQDSETQMQIVEGNAIWLETLRYFLGSIIIGGAFGYVICTLWVNVRGGVKGKMKNA
ncbi:MAG: hypothetical protein HDR03_07105 [Lachnospiraceae bacterium]|nr:hypothetical protein [Lachnospiraceae bacterium]